MPKKLKFLKKLSLLKKNKPFICQKNINRLKNKQIKKKNKP